MKNNSTYDEIIQALKKARRVLAVTHINPDGDALGSLCFFCELVKQFGIECVKYCAGPLPQSLEFLPGFSEIITDKSGLSVVDFDLIVSLDCATVARTNLETEIFNRSTEQTFIEIDHHEATKKVADLEVREPRAASTTEILFHIAASSDIKITPPMATCLLTGIVTDTASFIHPTTSRQTMTAAANMLGAGANISRIGDQTSRKKMTDLKLWGIALSRLKKNPRYDMVYTVLTAEDLQACQADADSLEGIAGFLSGLEDASAIMILYDFGQGLIRGSFRSTKTSVDVARLARLFGGGGHKQAAGFSVPGKLVFLNNQWRVVQ